MENICRVCMRVSRDLILISPKDDTDSEDDVALMFEDCLNLKLDAFPNYQKICVHCKIHLTYYYQFKQQALNTHCQLAKLENSYESDKWKEDDDVPAADNLIVDESEEHFLVEYLEDELPELAEYKEIINIKLEPDDVEKEDSIEEFHIEDLQTGEYAMEIIQPDELIHQSGTEGEEEEEIIITTNDWEGDDIDCEIEELEDEPDTKQKNKSRSWKFRCSPCKKNFRNDKTYQAHMNVHKGLPPYECSVCKKSFKYKVNYEYHMKNHYNRREFNCTLCEKKFLCRWDLKLHMRVHANIRPFICEICGKRFRVRSHMTDHRETHNENNTYECPICKQKYKTKVTLKLHLTTIHLKSRQHTCTICGKQFNRKHHLKVHSKVHEKNIKSDPVQ